MSDHQNASHHDAELILQLYDLRREAEMRKARTFITNFWPQSTEDVLKVVQAFGTQENAWLRQVLGYWNMVASLVLRGTLHEGLMFDNSAELWFVYAKLKPFIKEIREKMQMPEFLGNIEKVAERTPEGRERVETMKKRFARLSAMQAAAGSKTSAAD
ncbi:MAG TPA: hypothetical protein VFA76_01290 [Terriglobales bacterium]|nr:hypothetical protein [Terriglobales bacterium]